MNHDRPETGQEINLATILNILWRQRLFVLVPPMLGLVVALLYGFFAPRSWEAMTTISPGITAYGEDGAAVRQLPLRDITRWYEKRLYENEIVRRLGLPSGSQINIESEYAIPGLQDYVGGNAITLWTIARSPKLAAAILDYSLALFSEFSETDTIGNQLVLTRGNLELQISRQEAELSRINGNQFLVNLRIESARAESLIILAEDDQLRLQIESARAESLIIAADDEQLRLDLEKLARKQVYFDQRMSSLRDEESMLMADLAQLEQLIRRSTTSADTELEGSVEIPSWVRRDAILDSSTVLETLMRAKLHVQQALANNQAQRDDLIFQKKANDLDREKLDIHRETNIKARLREVGLKVKELMIQHEINTGVRLREVGRKVDELILEKSVFLPSHRQVTLAEIAGIQAKLRAVGPLHRMGKTVVSERPVRPRPLRAGLYLVLGGGIAGVILGIARNYLLANSHEILCS